MSEKVCYLFDKAGECIGSANTVPSPLDPEQSLIPVNATLKEPPKAQDGFTRIWDGISWELVEDHRGKIRYSTKPGSLGLEVTVDKVGPLNEAVPDTTDLPLPTIVPKGQCIVWADTVWGFAPLPREQQIAEMLGRLYEIDQKSIRPLREIAAGEATRGDSDRLVELAKEASALREQLLEVQA